jgi:cell division septum initiation protein DivIVA
METYKIDYSGFNRQTNIDHQKLQEYYNKNYSSYYGGYNNSIMSVASDPESVYSEGGGVSLKDMSNSAKNMADSAKNMAEIAKKKATSAKENIVDGAKNMADSAKEKMDAMADSAKEKTDAMVDSAKENIADRVDSAKKKMDAMVNIAKENVAERVGSVKKKRAGILNAKKAEDEKYKSLLAYIAKNHTDLKSLLDSDIYNLATATAPAPAPASEEILHNAKFDAFLVILIDIMRKLYTSESDDDKRNLNKLSILLYILNKMNEKATHSITNPQPLNFSTFITYCAKNTLFKNFVRTIKSLKITENNNVLYTKEGAPMNGFIDAIITTSAKDTPLESLEGILLASLNSAAIANPAKNEEITQIKKKYNLEVTAAEQE